MGAPGRGRALWGGSGRIGADRGGEGCGPGGGAGGRGRGAAAGALRPGYCGVGRPRRCGGGPRVAGRARSGGATEGVAGATEGSRRCGGPAPGARPTRPGGAAGPQQRLRRPGTLDDRSSGEAGRPQRSGGQARRWAAPATAMWSAATATARRGRHGGVTAPQRRGNPSPPRGRQPPRQCNGAATAVRPPPTVGQPAPTAVWSTATATAQRGHHDSATDTPNSGAARHGGAADSHHDSATGPPRQRDRHPQ